MQSSYQTHYFVQPWKYLLPEKNYPATVEDTDKMNMLGQIFKTKSRFFLKIGFSQKDNLYVKSCTKHFTFYHTFDMIIRIMHKSM